MSNGKDTQKPATDFKFVSVKIDGHEVNQMVFSVEIYEHAQITAVTGTVVLVETAANQFLEQYGIEGNETIEMRLEDALGNELGFKGYVNRISNKVVTTTGTSTYSVEFTSAVVRQNEQMFITHRFKEDVGGALDYVAQRLNENSKYPLKVEKKGDNGMPMNFVASMWSPTRVIKYILKNGVASSAGGKTTLTNEPREDGEGKGMGGYYFYETLKGFRHGSSYNFLNGDLGSGKTHKLQYTFANDDQTTEEKRKHILDFRVLQNNDTQTQQRAGAYRSKFVVFDMDVGAYMEQEYVSPLATQKQLDTSKLPTRIFNKPITNERWNQSCKPAARNQLDRTLQCLQQSEASLNNLSEGRAQFTIPLRIDINVGDKVDTLVYQASVESVAKRDEKFSGVWVVTAVAHHYLLDSAGAYTRITCIRSSQQTDEGESYAKIPVEL
jgi:hypothetical protein